MMAHTGLKYLAIFAALAMVTPLHSDPQADGQKTNAYANQLNIAQNFRWHITERADFSIYKNGIYQGQLHFMARGSFATETPGFGEDASLSDLAPGFKGEFLVSKGSVREAIPVSELEDIQPAHLTYNRFLGISQVRGKSLPHFRGLPALPEIRLKPGDHWTAAAQYSFEPLQDGDYVIIPGVADYIVDTAQAPDGATLKISATLRLKPIPGQTLGGSKLATLGGVHKMAIVLDSASLMPIQIVDKFEETWSVVSGPTMKRAGFILVFFQQAESLDGKNLLPGLADALNRASAKLDKKQPAAEGSTANKSGELPGASGAPGTAFAQAAPEIARATPESTETSDAHAGTLADDLRDRWPGSAPELAASVELAETDRGIVLRVNNLQFIADSDALKPEEAWKLDAIAESLKDFKDRNFLVVGHSAAVGKAEGELALSRDRAAYIARELAKRGIEASRIIFEGRGSAEPVASNNTEAGRAKNRRVEITILN